MKNTEHDVPETWCFPTCIKTFDKNNSFFFLLNDKNGPTPDHIQWLQDYKAKITSACAKFVVENATHIGITGHKAFIRGVW